MTRWRWFESETLGLRVESENFVRVEKVMAVSWGIAGQRGASPGATGLVGPHVFPGMPDQSVTAGCVARVPC